MGVKILKSLIDPYLRVTTCVLVLLAAILFFFSVPAGLIAVAVILGLSLYYRRLSLSKTELLQEYANTITEAMEETTHHFISHNPLPLCMMTNEGEILWINSKLAEIFEEVEMFHTNIHQITGLKVGEFLKCEEGKAVTVTKNGRIYNVISSSLQTDDTENNIMLLWQDVTNLETLKNLYKEERLCAAYINVDNYDDLINSSPDERKGVVAGQIEKTLRQWAGKLSASFIKYKSGQYFLTFEQKHFEKQEENKFSILDEVREIETDADFPASVSIGIGVGGKTPQQLEEYAKAALDLALGRGGDQAVVKKMSKVEYYGGRLQAVEKRNKGKSRIMAHALRQLISQSQNVVIMGHERPDMDCFGAALGICRLAINREKEAAIVINSFHESLMDIYNRAVDTGIYNFVNNEAAVNLVTKDTLLVVVDTHRPSLTECPNLLYKTDKIVVFDHHRRAEEMIENPTLTYMETYASSTCELVTEILQYISDKKEIDRLEAEALLGGIVMDTKNFSVKTGVRTFEAASWLRRSGADTTVVRAMFQTDLEFFRRKSAMIAKAEMVRPGIALTYTEAEMENMHILTSQAADDLLDLRGMKASFAVGKSPDGRAVVSARSLGQINVQTILEKMGGGGHLIAAGAQLDLSIQETAQKLKALIMEIDIVE